MTAAEAAALIVELTCELSERTRERDAFRMVAVAAIHHAHDLHVEVEDLRARYYRALDDARSLRTSMLQREGSGIAA